MGGPGSGRRPGGGTPLQGKKLTGRVSRKLESKITGGLVGIGEPSTITMKQVATAARKILGAKKYGEWKKQMGYRGK